MTIDLDAIKALLASLPADATPGRYRASPGFMSEHIVREREPHDDITVGSQIVGYCEHDATRVLLAAAPSLRDALRATLPAVEHFRAAANILRPVALATEHTADTERAAIVAWLRARAALGLAAENVEGAFIFGVTADEIENNGHRRKDKE